MTKYAQGLPSGLTPNVQRLFNDFLKLSDSEKIVVAEFFRRDQGEVVRAELRNIDPTQLIERILGPITNDTCPLCGK